MVATYRLNALFQTKRIIKLHSPSARDEKTMAYTLVS